MTLPQIAMIAGALAILAGPQIVEGLRAMASRGSSSSSHGGRPFDRASAVADLLKLQGQMADAGLDTAADLAGRLLVELVTLGKGQAPNTGGKK